MVRYGEHLHVRSVDLRTWMTDWSLTIDTIQTLWHELAFVLNLVLYGQSYKSPAAKTPVTAMRCLNGNCNPQIVLRGRTKIATSVMMLNAACAR